jgi:hypothetical protein
MIKVGYVLSLVCWATIAIANPPANQLDELSPLLQALAIPQSPQQTAENLRKYLEKATDIAVATIKKSGAKISEKKLKEFKDDMHAELWDELEDFSTPIDKD